VPAGGGVLLGVAYIFRPVESVENTGVKREPKNRSSWKDKRIASHVRDARGE